MNATDETWLGVISQFSPIDLQLVFQNAGLFARGLFNTIILLASTLVAAAVIAVPLAIIRARRVPVINRIVFAYVYLFRGTPMLVQLYLIYYGAAQFEFVRHSFLWPMLREAWWCVLLSFAVCSGAYLTEILRGAIEGVPRGEIEAAKACGMSEFTIWRRVTLPIAFRRALPAYSNEAIFALHGTVIASTVTIVDVLGAARQFNNKYYLGMDGFLVAASLYVGLVYMISLLFRAWEKRWHRHLRRA